MVRGPKRHKDIKKKLIDLADLTHSGRLFQGSRPEGFESVGDGVGKFLKFGPS